MLYYPLLIRKVASIQKVKKTKNFDWLLIYCWKYILLQHLLSFQWEQIEGLWKTTKFDDEMHLVNHPTFIYFTSLFKGSFYQKKFKTSLYNIFVFTRNLWLISNLEFFDNNSI